MQLDGPIGLLWPGRHYMNLSSLHERKQESETRSTSDSVSADNSPVKEALTQILPAPPPPSHQRIEPEPASVSFGSLGQQT